MASSVFVGYPSRPELSRETLAAAARKLDRQPDLDVVSWEELHVAGRLIIDRVLAAISNATVSVFDVTTMNENVMFEVGYAIGSDARIWLVRDTSDTAANRRWHELGILTTVGYHPYANSDDLVAGYLSERPDLRDDTFFRESIEPTLDPVSEPMLFYVKGPVPTEAERDITRQVQHQRRAGIRCIVSDYRESSVEPLTWYAYQCYAASAVLLHLARPERRGAATHNARCALIGGLAKGLGRPLLMVAEHGYALPLDYRHLLYTYKSAREARNQVRYWLGRELASAYAEIEKRASEAQQRKLSTELASIRLGEPVAENEADRLQDYFLPTASFRDVLAPITSVFVGRKGTGKTANLLRAADELSQDKRNLVCIIRPSDYDLEGLLRILRELSQRDVQGYLVETLWRYLLLSEIARSIWDQIRESAVPPAPGSAEWELDVYMRGAGSVFNDDFVVRLEESVAHLTEKRTTTIG